MARRSGLALLVSMLACGCGADRDGAAASQAGIEIVVDDMGVPHVYASNDEDLFYGYGYQLACDRMLQLEMWRRFAYGTRSAVLGADFKGSFGSTSLEDDKLVRLFGLPHWGALDAELMREQHPERWKLVQAWREGINRRVREIRDGVVPRPFGFGEQDLDFLPDEWTENDPFIVQKMIQLGLDQTLSFEILLTLLSDLAPKTLESVRLFEPAHPAWAVPPEDMPEGVEHKDGPASAGTPGAAHEARALPDWAKDPSLWSRLVSAPKAGSNNWVVDGRFTENGKPMLAGDPHLVFTLMGAMYAIHLSSIEGGGTFDVAGFAFAPAPGIFAGQTRGAMWAPTSAFGDVMDLWSVEQTPNGVKVGGKVVPTDTREEVIEVRNGSDELITISDVPGYGVIFDPSFAGVPVPLAGEGRAVLLGWTGFRARSSLYFLELDRSETADDFDTAVKRIPEMSYNWLAADENGIDYRVSLEVPKRNPIAPGREPWRVMNGDDPASLWAEGSLSFDQLPHGRAEKRGWIATANNDPFGFTADGDPTNDGWYYGALFDPGYRAQRISEELERLTQRGNIGLADMQALQTDDTSRMSDGFIELLSEAWANVDSDESLAEFRSRPELASLVKLITVDWDRKMTRDSPGALAFHAYAHFVTGAALEDDMIPLLYERVLEAAPFYVLKVAELALRGKYPKGNGVLQEGRDAIVLRGLEQTAELLTQRFGGVEAERYRWGDMHVTSFDNAFGLGMPLPSVPTNGGENTIDVAHSVFRKDFEIPQQWVSNYGPVERLVGRFDDAGVPELWVNFPPGNVADPASSHFSDMLDDWVEGRYQKLAFSRDEVEARAERRVSLQR